MKERNFALERKEDMRSKLMIQLPIPIDSKRYVMGKLAFSDLLIISPFALTALMLGTFFFSIGVLNEFTIIIASSPIIGIAAMQFMKHKVRKNLTFLQYGVLWHYQFKKREKEFFNKKGVMEMGDKQDSRRKVGIKTLYADCYETTDNRLVRVFEVSSVNLALSNKIEKRAVLDSFKVFMNTLNFVRTIQFAQIAQPINLDRHLRHMKKKNPNEDNQVKSMLQESYKKKIDSIQQSRDLVTRKRYIVLSEKIGNDAEKALDKIDQKSNLIISKIENMTFDQTSLSIHQLNNDELLKLMHTCVDYDSAVAVSDHIVSMAQNRSSMSMGEESAQQLIDTLSQQLKEKVY